MLYCKKCGNPVDKTDVFCSACMARLGVPGAVITKAERSFEASQKSEFNPDAVLPSPDLCGFEVFNHRLTEKAASFAGADFYTAAALDGISDLAPYVKHIMLPKADDISGLMFGVRLDEKRAADNIGKYISGIESEQLAFQQNCSVAGVDSLHYAAKTYSSGLYGSHHVFFLMKNALPLPYYLAKYRVTMRQAIEIALNLCDGLIRLRRTGYYYGPFSDEMIYITKDKKVYFDLRIPQLNGNLSPFDSSYSRYRMFIAPDNTDRDVYSLAMLLYLMLSGYKHPWCNPIHNDIMNDEFIQAEYKRISRQQPYTPYLAMNMLGNLIINSISGFEEKTVTIEEFFSALKNSFNYISPKELDEVIPIAES